MQIVAFLCDASLLKVVNYKNLINFKEMKVKKNFKKVQLCISEDLVRKKGSLVLVRVVQFCVSFLKC